MRIGGLVDWRVSKEQGVRRVGRLGGCDRGFDRDRDRDSGTLYTAHYATCIAFALHCIALHCIASQRNA